MREQESNHVRAGVAVSRDGTVIAYQSLGQGPGLVIVGGALSTGPDYLPLARALAGCYEVHVMERRGRPGSGPQRAGHSIADEIDDLAAVAAATGSEAVFGHSFGGLVALEAARRPGIFSDVLVYEPGVPVRGQIPVGWLDDYQRRLERGDRRGAFARMAKGAGNAPPPIGLMPVWLVRLMLRLALSGEKWAGIDRMLETNLAEHRVLASLDAPDAGRFSAITARTVLLAGDKGPDAQSGPLLRELAAVIPHAQVAVLPGLSHLAPLDKPDTIASAVLAHCPAGRAAR